jgi:hypothetical protein
MTIQFKVEWNGYDAGGVYTLSGAEEARLIGLGIASSYSPVPKLSQVFVTESGQLVDTNQSTVSGGAPIYTRLAAAIAAARNNNPWDLGVMSSPPTVTVGATALANGQTKYYFDTDGYKKIRILGIPWGDQSLMIANAGGYVLGRQLAGSSGALSYANNYRGYLAEVGPFAGQIIQFVVNGLSAALLRFRVDGALVSTTPTSAGTTIVQLDFGTVVNKKTIGIEFEQAQTLRGVIVGPNDTLGTVEDPRLPVMVYGDSYVQGQTSPQSVGGLTFVSALRDIGGINAIGHGIAGSGYAVSTPAPANDPDRLAWLAQVTNAAGAPIVLIPMGTNDWAQSTAAIQASAAAVGAYLLANTSAKLAFVGPWPQSRNNVAGATSIENAVIAAVAAMDQTRAGMIPVCTGANPWVTGTGSTSRVPDGSTYFYGNSRLVTGDDNIHLNPAYGTEYMARRVLDATLGLCKAKGW